MLGRKAASQTLSEAHLAQLHALYKKECWSSTRSLADTRAVAGSPVYVALVDERDELIAFARVLTDYIFKAFIFEVIVQREHRSEGLGGQLISLVKSHPRLHAVRHFELCCRPEM